MSSSLFEKRAYTGLFRRQIDGLLYLYEWEGNTLVQTTKDIKDPHSLKSETRIPIWLLRHSLGIDGDEEDYSGYKVEVWPNKSVSNQWEQALNAGKEVRNLFYTGLKVPVSKEGYSHAVGPIHAGVIEPGHFRFTLNGEVIQSLDIRLGFQHRGILEKLVDKNSLQALPLAETISGDTTVAYATAFSRCFEQACDLEETKATQLWRAVLLEVERCAIHIGDIGAIAGDIGYYPLQGVGCTDRGVPLGVMEKLTGSRFGKGAIHPGGVLLSKKLEKKDLETLSSNLKKCWQRVGKEFRRAVKTNRQYIFIKVGRLL
jgi:hypothetical protein